MMILCSSKLKKGLKPRLTCSNLPSSKYLFLITCETNDWGCCSSLHIYFARTAVLKASIFLNSNPPLVLDFPNFNHFLNYIFLSLCLWIHQNFEILEAISLQSFLGSLNSLSMFRLLGSLILGRLSSLLVKENYRFSCWISPKLFSLWP